MSFDIIVKKNSRIKNIRIVVHSDRKVIVTAPKLLPNYFISRFVKSKSDWIHSKLDFFVKNSTSKLDLSRRISKKEYGEYKKQAQELATKRLEYFNKFYNFEYKKISIRNQKTRWGSCSKRKNLNFNYKIIFLAPKQQDYIFIHELCHLQEFNHGKKFWELVSKKCPDFKNIRSSVKKIRL